MFDGFRTQPTVHGIFGNPKVRHHPGSTLKKAACDCCGRTESGWYDRCTRRVSDRSNGDMLIYLDIEVRRVQCRHCGKVKRERSVFLAENPQTLMKSTATNFPCNTLLESRPHHLSITVEYMLRKSTANGRLPLPSRRFNSGGWP